jgi:two-component system cell cycle response regulator
MTSSQTVARETSTVNPLIRPRILVADDSRVIRLAIMKILGTDFDIVQVENGVIAWEQVCQDSTIQAVLTDIQMPQMDGYELICRIRAAEEARVRDLPVITITGTDDDAIKQQAMACGATDFIVKPLDALQLRARVQAYVRYDRTTRELSEKSLSLEEQAITDPQTGLRSRRYLTQRGEQDIAYAQRHGQDLSLLRVDIDGFKKIYRAHGDEVGDRLIEWVAKRLYSTARTEDTVARVSGAEFALLATNTSMAEAAPLCDRILAAVTTQPFSLGSVTVPVTVTIGLASLKEDRCDSIEALTRLAHQRLCHASSEGGNRVCKSVMDDDQATVEEVMLTPVDGLLPESSLSLAVEESVPMPEPVPELETQPLAVAEVTSDDSSSSAQECDVSPLTMASPLTIVRNAEEQFSATPQTLPAELLGVDKALALLAQGKGQLLLPYLEMLMREIRPLIELHEHIRSAGKP